MQLVEQWLSTPEVRGSNRVIRKFIYALNCNEKTKIKKEAGNAPVKKCWSNDCGTVGRAVASDTIEDLGSRPVIRKFIELLIVKKRRGCNQQLSLTNLGSGCGAVGRAVAFDTRGPGFDSSHWQLLLNIYLLLTVCRKDENKEKRSGMAHFKKNKKKF